MTFARVIPLFSLALSALYIGALADSAKVGKRQAMVDRDLGSCAEPSWVPACPGTLACVPSGPAAATCCSDGVSYAIPPQSCPDKASPAPNIAPGVGPGSAPGVSPGSAPGVSPGSAPGVGPGSAPGVGPGSAPGVGPGDAPGVGPAPAGITPAPHDIPGPKAPGIDFLSVGSDWYTFGLTFHYLSHWYSHGADHASVLVSAEITLCTTVSVSATDEAQASELASAYVATAAPAVPTETHAAPSVPAAVEGAAPVDPVPTVAPSFSTASPSGSGTWTFKNETATKLPSPVVTAGASRLAGLEVAAAALGLLIAVTAGFH